MLRLTGILLLAATLTLAAGTAAAQTGNNNPVLRVYQLTTELTNTQSASSAFQGSLESAGIKYTVDDADGDLVTVAVQITGVTIEGILPSMFISQSQGYYEKTITSNNQAFFNVNNTLITILLTATDNSAFGNQTTFTYRYRVETGGGPPAPSTGATGSTGGCVGSGTAEAPWWMLVTLVAILGVRRAIRRRPV